MKLARLVIGPNSEKLKAESLEAYLGGDKERAVDLLAEARLRDRQFARALKALDN